MDNKVKQTEKTTQPVVVYPRFLGTHPQGIDLFEGKSQERLAEAIALHISETDKQEKPVFSRLIGLEGKWGSGKSNVIKILEERLTDTYTFFCFDAWGNQEDLQRRSILELLTRYLIEKGKLKGKAKIKVLSSASEGNLSEEECTWAEKLESLLSRKSYTKDITVPSLNNSTKWFVLVLLLVGLFVAYLSVNHSERWWINLLIALSPFIIFTIIMFITGGSWQKMFAMYNTEGRSDTTSYVISEQEPSVREFKDWMKELSEGIPPNEKMVLIFDNMDRLSSDKVHQFWSLIQTFFADADNGYNNIWCIVPYDEKHLASVFGKENDDDNSVNLLRGFLNKTFPVVFRVPEPIVADYKMIFDHLFREAFGDTVSSDDTETISRCYRQIHTEPNVREMITFINGNVLLAKQWNGIIHPLSFAIYVLKADLILRNPKISTTKGTGGETENVSTEEYLLAKEYASDFKKILFGNPAKSYLQKEIAAIVYGVEPQKAQQIIVKRHIRNCIADKEGKLTFEQYVNTSQFMLLLDDDIHNMDVTEYERAVMLIDRIDASKLSQNDTAILDRIWHYMGQQYNALKSPENEFGEYHNTLFKHLKPDEGMACATTFCQRIVDNKDVDGDKLFEHLSTLFESDFAADFVPDVICPTIQIGPERFAEYVKYAEYEYKRFPLYCDANELNRFIEGSIGKDFPYLIILQILKNAETYSVAQVGEYAVQQLNLMKADTHEAVNYIDIQRVFYEKFQSTLTPEYVNTLWQSVQNEKGNPVYDEIYALKAKEGVDQMPNDADSINSLSEKIHFYISTTDLFRLFLQNLNITFRRNLLIKMLNDEIHDNNPVFPEFVEHWQNLADNLGVEKRIIVQFADNWGYRSLSEQSRAKTYFNLLSDAAWIDELLAADTPLAKELLRKCVGELIKQDVNQFIQPNTANHTNNNWDLALRKLIDTPYFSESNLGTLTSVAADLLDFVARNSSFNDTTWNKLLGKVDYASISSSFVETRNRIFRGQDGYAMNAGKFKQLHIWLEQCEINTKDHCSDAANQILAKVVDDIKCQEIILTRKDYYSPIIVNTIQTASVLHEKLKTILKNQGETEFANYIKKIINYDAVDKLD